jgi:hypothetical protein
MKEYICTHHDNIIKLCDEIIEAIDRDGNINSTCKTIYIAKAKNIRKEAETAKVAGQVMENRMKVYRTGIENMGFNRNKKKKPRVIGVGKYEYIK